MDKSDYTRSMKICSRFNAVSVSSGIESGSELFAYFRSMNIAVVSRKAFARNYRQ